MTMHLLVRASVLMRCIFALNQIRFHLLRTLWQLWVPCSISVTRAELKAVASVQDVVSSDSLGFLICLRTCVLPCCDLVQISLQSTHSLTNWHLVPDLICYQMAL